MMITGVIQHYDYVAPVRERGLKFYDAQQLGGCQSRSREGAWIEMSCTLVRLCSNGVAPVRERGLKSPCPVHR